LVVGVTNGDVGAGEKIREDMVKNP